MRRGIFRISHFEDSDLSPSGPERLHRETNRRGRFQNTRVRSCFFSASHIFLLSHNSHLQSEVISCFCHVLQQVALTLLLFISLQHVPQKKREKKKTFLPHITVLPQFQCRLLCWVVASNASVSAKNYQMQITHKNAGSKTVSNDG